MNGSYVFRESDYVFSDAGQNFRMACFLRVLRVSAVKVSYTLTNLVIPAATETAREMESRAIHRFDDVWTCAAADVQRAVWSADRA